MGQSSDNQGSIYSTRSKREEATESIFQQYEQTLIESIITSFGLNFIMGDQHGGDVDTIHNVRQIGTDPKMIYKNQKNDNAYETRGEYNSTSYHSHRGYKQVNKENSEKKEMGVLENSYLGTVFKRNDKVDLDHTIAAKEIHDDRGRVLAGLGGEELANAKTNLRPTDPHTNRSKKAKTMEKHLEDKSAEYSADDKERMLKADREARNVYNRTVSQKYYTSAQFASDLTRSAAKSAAKMGVKEALGFVFAEIWFELKKVFGRARKPLELRDLFHDIGEGIRKGFSNAKEKYRTLMAKIKEGALSGVFSNIITSICNIFLTTAKNVVRIIREGTACLLKAAKVLFINRENLPPEEQLKSVLKILSVGVSVIFGSLVSQMIENTGVGKIPVIGEIIQTFAGSFTTGILTCTFLWFFDKSATMNKVYDYISQNRSRKNDSEELLLLEKKVDEYAAQLMNIDLKSINNKITSFEELSKKIYSSKNDNELNDVLDSYINEHQLKLPWEGSFETFMADPNNVLVFE